MKIDTVLGIGYKQGSQMYKFFLALEHTSYCVSYDKIKCAQLLAMKFIIATTHFKDCQLMQLMKCLNLYLQVFCPVSYMEMMRLKDFNLAGYIHIKTSFSAVCIKLPLSINNQCVLINQCIF